MITPRDITWRPDNEAEHMARHGIAFETAARVFLDPARRDVEVRRGRYGERRFKVVGLIDGLYVAVIFALEDGVVRIISARRANKREWR